MVVKSIHSFPFYTRNLKLKFLENRQKEPNFKINNEPKFFFVDYTQHNIVCSIFQSKIIFLIKHEFFFSYLQKTEKFHFLNI